MSAPVIHIEKLDEKNYDSWSIQMKSVLVHSGHWKIVSGVLKIDSADVKKEQWESDDEKALASIFLGVKPTQLVYIRSCKTSSEAWEKLKNVHMPIGPLQKVSLYKRLVSLNMANGNVVGHINEFAEICEKLSESGIEIQEELLAIILLSSLSSEYENFVIAMETRDALPNLSQLKQKLLEEGKRRKETEAKPTSLQQQAFLAKNTSDSKGNKKYSSSKKFKGKCFVCGVAGHFANKCEKRQRNFNNMQAMTMVAAADTKSLKADGWYVDSGATSHMCNDRKLFVRIRDHNEEIALAGNKFITASAKGDVLIKNRNFEVLLQNVLFCSELQANFISVNKTVDCGLSVVFDAQKALIKRSDGTIVLVAKRRDNMFVADNEKTKERVCAIKEKNLVLWHNRYGHLNFKSLQDLNDNQMVKGMFLNSISDFKCRTCMLSKIHVLPFPKESQTKTSQLLEVVHSDVCGPFKVNSVGGARYFVTFIDDMSRRICVYFIKHKSEVFEKFKMYKNYVEKQTGCRIKTLRSDNGGEYINSPFESFLSAEGIGRQLTVPYTPQQNGVAERANRTLIEMARSMMVHAGVKEYLWAEAVNTAAYIRNRCPTKRLENKTPHEVWFGRKPSVQHFKTFGAYAVSLNKSSDKSKFKAKGLSYIMVGYSATSKAYRLFNTTTRKVIEQRNVIFDEKMHNVDNSNNENGKKSLNADDYLTFCFNVDKYADVVDCNSRSSVQIESDEESYGTADNDDDTDNGIVGQQAIHYRGRPKIIRDGKRGRPKKQFNTKQANELCVAIEEEIPETVEDALASLNKQQWVKAMDDEIYALRKNKTWSLTDLPEGHKAIPCKWVFALKKNIKGEVERFKARLVAKGCNQRFGIDYKETFSPVVRYSTIRLLLALAVKHKMHLHQMDVRTAYLNGELQDEIYMKQPPNFIDEKSPNAVLKLNKAIYGLKQSGKEWNNKLDSVLRRMNFNPCENEPCLYRSNIDGNLVLIAVYVDDLIIACGNLEIVYKVKAQISNEFEVDDKGILKHFLGMEIERQGETGMIKLSQSQYIANVLMHYGMDQCKAVFVPLEAGYQVDCKDNCKKFNQHDYQSLVGTLMYLAISTRPDILHSVSKMAQRNTDAHEEHMTKLKHILRYLSGTRNLKMIFDSDGSGLEGYVDADWGGNAMDRKSYTGFTFFYDGSLISWESKKQNTIALSSTEAEYMAASDGAKEAVYLKKLLFEIDGYKRGVTKLNIDNQGAMKLAENPVFHKRSKHIDIRYHHIRELVRDGQINLTYCPTQNMIADVLTKNLSKIKHVNFVKQLKLE